MLHRQRCCAIALILLMLSACASNDSKVHTDYRPGTNFDRYQRFSWADDSGGDKSISPFILEHVREALAQELKTGLYQPAPQQADFLVRYYVAEAANTIDRSPRIGIGLGSFTGNIGMSTSVGVPIGQDKVNRNIQILIHLLDAKTRTLSWQGAILMPLDDADPEANQHRVHQSVAKIWSHFPPK
ncbi:MAG: DUF4136 domain-containing protein [Spongiibacter sp.]|uniref:DUF4136 domain-containing protein n=1 Tax=Spongiibacter thalassae TaxID=2721624 RepID=A0ABX1GM64_9GAMM|nr:DUF4136 domain-containing protein [Spongiibacter thalassae]MDX1505256.1 DUF4136 domain-containing protein [Spongiibacter sp.]NKI19507.1 DUF4136 domain-containing protein [Spongiibacter thalassae]